jgi:hypothetical protein
MCLICAYGALSGSAFGCFCFSSPMCGQIGTLSENVVFVGRVVEIWPTREAIANQQHLSHAQLRNVIIQRWRGVLSVQEERYIRTSAEWDKIEFRYAYMQRVRFVVSEVFTGPSIREIFTDSSSCGYRFESNQIYLVNSTRDGTRYRSRTCSRTARVESESATEDLNALRAWKSGTPLSPRVYGRISPADIRSDILIRLTRDRDESWTPLDASGGFFFDGLEKAEYRLQIRDGRGTGERLIDLSKLGCFEANPWFSDVWHIAGSPVVLEPKPPVR